MTLENVEVWFQDEARIGQQGTVTRVCTLKGTRFRLKPQKQFISSDLFGAVCPQRDKAVGFILPWANTQMRQLHLQEIAVNIQEGKHAVLVMD